MAVTSGSLQGAWHAEISCGERHNYGKKRTIDTTIKNPYYVERRIMKRITFDNRRRKNHKTTFHTKRSTFCYRKMQFGLRNIGATYQRLVD